MKLYSIDDPSKQIEVSWIYQNYLYYPVKRQIHNIGVSESDMKYIYDNKDLFSNIKVVINESNVIDLSNSNLTLIYPDPETLIDYGPVITYYRNER